MKIKFILDTENIDDEFEARRMMKSSNMALALFEITHNIKRTIEWEIDAKEAASDPYDVLDSVFEKIFTELQNQHIDIDELLQ